MRYETIIIGGGLTGLLSGIMLAEKGQNVAIVSAGQSALHFSSGSFELFAGDENPLRGIESLPESHPYKKVGVDNVGKYADMVKDIFLRAGIRCNGDKKRNHYRITPIGILKPAWLTMDDYALIEEAGALPWRRVALVNIDGYLDFYPKFLESFFAKSNVECQVCTLSHDAFDHLRESVSEMRATNIARIMTGDILADIAGKLNEMTGSAEVVFMPAVLGLYDDNAVARLRSLVKVPLYFIPTMPASVPGVRMQIQLKNYFQKLGGTYLLGDTVKSGAFEDGRLVSVRTANHDKTDFKADNFILATGSFFSHGLMAAQDRIYEPVFGLDVVAGETRSQWYDNDLYASQPYMGYGVKTDNELRCLLDGKAVANLYAAGSVLAMQNSLEDGTGGGVAIATALFIADKIFNA